MGILENANAIPTAAAAAGFYTYQIANSCRFDGTSYLTDTRASDGSATTGTISFWFKRSGMGEYGLYLMTAWEDGNNGFRINFLEDDTIEFRNETGGAVKHELETTQVFRDTSAWYHFVGIIDYTNGTPADRAQMWINGERVTAFETETYPADASQTMVLNTGAYLRWGAASDGGYDTKGYMAECVVIDGTAEAATDFGESKNGVWIPKDPSGLTFGTNGFYLNYASSGDMGNDVSGNNNDFALTNIVAADQMLDSPSFGSEGSANFATLGPLWKTPNMTFSEGNLKWSTSTNQRGVMSNWSVPLEGKFYWEYIPTAFGASSGDDMWCGLNIATVDFTASRGGEGTSYSYGANLGQKNIAGTASSYGDAWGDDDKIGVAVDRVNDTLQFSKNGVWQGSAFALHATADLFPWIGSGGGTSAASGTFNFGADGTFAGLVTAQGNADENGYGNFFYAPPSGFVALCAANLPTPAADPAEEEGPENYFKVLTPYAGGTTGHVTGFQPDLVWTKRTTDGQSNAVWDSSRGTTKVLNTDATNAEGTSSGLTAFNSDGYDMGTYYNQSGDSYVSWNWKVNGGTTASNSIGDKTSTVQVDTDRGISIVQYTGNETAETIGHSLGAKPELIMVKCRSFDRSWAVQWVDVNNTTSYILNTTGSDASSGYWNNTSPTSSVFSVGGGTETNKDSQTFIAYCFVSKEGFSKVGTYEGNGNANGTFVCTGFRPAFIMTRSVDSTSDWQIFDELREGYNIDNDELVANSTAAETTTDYIDILSNGFKLRTTSDPNVAETYGYIAFAKNPFKFAVAR